MGLPVLSCDVFVAGCGMTGASAALFAARSGLSVTQAGSTAEIVFASGLFDVWDDPDPWDALAELREKRPDHPYARLSPRDVRDALETFLDWLGQHGLPYRSGGDKSCEVLTPMGARKRTWAVPETMWAGVEACRTRAATLLADFTGLREYSAAQTTAVAGRDWPGLRSVRLDFPAPVPHPLLPGSMAQSLELDEHRAALAEAVRPHLAPPGMPPALFVGMPAVLGMSHSREVTADLEARLGVRIFEIPTLPASVPGMRLKNLFENRLDREGVTPRRLTRALSVEPDGEFFRVLLGSQKPEEEVRARHVILATGRFVGRGLRAERDGIRERLMNLPVAQPPTREHWHRDDLFDPAGHPVNRAGVMVDARFRPVDHEGRVIHPRLHAAGTLLAHQDWVREKCGVGLALGTARAAVRDCLENR